jgi:hypothetical protein
MRRSLAQAETVLTAAFAISHPFLSLRPESGFDGTHHLSSTSAARRGSGFF